MSRACVVSHRHSLLFPATSCCFRLRSAATRCFLQWHPPPFPSHNFMRHYPVLHRPSGHPCRSQDVLRQKYLTQRPNKPAPAARKRMLKRNRPLPKRQGFASTASQRCRFLPLLPLPRSAAPPLESSNKLNFIVKTFLARALYVPR